MTRNWFIQPNYINAEPVLRRASAQFPITSKYFAVTKIIELSQRFKSYFEVVSKVVPCLPDEAKQWMMALPASLFRIGALVGPVLLSKDRDDMGI